MCFLGVFECVELCRAAPQAGSLGRRVNQIDRNQSSQPLQVLGLDDQVGESTSDRIDHHATELSADPVATGDLFADGVLGHIAHR